MIGQTLCHWHIEEKLGNKDIWRKLVTVRCRDDDGGAVFRDVKFDRETKNTVRHAEEADGRTPVIGTVYVNKDELPRPFPKRIRVPVEMVE